MCRLRWLYIVTVCSRARVDVCSPPVTTNEAFVLIRQLSCTFTQDILRHPWWQWLPRRLTAAQVWLADSSLRVREAVIVDQPHGHPDATGVWWLGMSSTKSCDREICTAWMVSNARWSKLRTTFDVYDYLFRCCMQTSRSIAPKHSPGFQGFKKVFQDLLAPRALSASVWALQIWVSPAWLAWKEICVPWLNLRQPERSSVLGTRYWPRLQRTTSSSDRWYINQTGDLRARAKPTTT